MTRRAGGRDRASTEHDVFLRLVRVAELLARSLADTLEPFKLTLSQYSVLQALRHAGPEGLACREIADRLLARDPDITRLVDRLEARGLVLRQRGRPDRRVVRTRITDEGMGLLRDVDGPVMRLHERHLGRMGLRDLGTFTALLESAGATA